MWETLGASRVLRLVVTCELIANQICLRATKTRDPHSVLKRVLCLYTVVADEWRPFFGAVVAVKL